MLQLINYSEKAIAVIGDTKEKATELKKLGGRFNFRLTCGAGWIFPKKAETQLRALVEGKEPEQENPLADARVYVGTYGKYNSGSIAGAWLNLADYKNKEEFLAACARLHKNEPDPEFMFQDWEGVPSWLIRESWISPEVWQQKPEEHTGKQSRAEIRAILEKVLPSGRDLDYYTKKTAAIVEIEGKFFDFEKPTIETRFCHPDEPEKEAREWLAYARTWEHFKSENLDALDTQIARLEGATLGNLSGAFIFKQHNNLWEFGVDADRYYLTSENEATPMTEQTRQALLKACKEARADFEKRLATWWKKYGADKLHIWTYWADR